MAKPFASIQIPVRDLIQDATGKLTRSWEIFFRTTKEALDTLGVERNYPLLNNQSTAIDIEGLNFDSAFVSQGIVDFLIQRITTGTGANELIASGTFHVVYKPISNSWALVMIGTPGPSTSGITFSITAIGEVRYISSNITGTASISRIVYRSRILRAKDHSYSLAGV